MNDPAFSSLPPDEREERTRRALLHMLEDLRQERDVVRKSKRQWLETVDAIHDPILVHDGSFRIVRVNKAYAARAQCSFAELIGRPYWEHFPKRDGPLPGCTVGLASAGIPDVFTLENGETFVSHVYRMPIGENSGMLSLHLFEDVTESRRAQDALERSERHYRKLIEGGSDIFFVLDAAGRLRYRSEAGRSLTGYDTAEVLGKQITDFLTPESRAAAERLLAQVMQRPGETAAGEFRAQARDGSLIDVEATARNLLADPDVGGIVVTARDVTERKRRQVELSLFRELIDRSGDGIWVIDPDTHRFLDVNAHGCEQLGYSRAELLAMSFREVAPETDRAVIAKIERELAQSGAAAFESVHQRKDGSTFPVDIRIRRVTFDRRYNVVTVRDITERKRAEEALRSSRDLLRSVIEHVPMRVFWKDRDLRYLGCNAQFARDAGRAAPQELIGKDDFQMGWREQAELYRADDRRVMDSGEPKIGYEEPQTGPDGQAIWLRTSKVPLHDGGGKVIGVLGIYEDITDHKRAALLLQESEAKFRALVESTSDWIWEVGADIRYKYSSPQVEHVLGYSPAEVLGRSPFDFMPADEAARVAAKFASIRAAKQGIRVLENANLTKDGRAVMLETSAVPILGAAGELLGYRGIDRDITERRRAETAMAEQLKELQRWHDLNLGREDRVLELKREVNDLLERLREPRRYASADEEPKPLEATEA